LIKILKKYHVYLLSFLFVALNSFFVIKGFYYIATIPFVLALIYLALFNVEKLMWFIVFTTPISMNIEELDFGGIGMYLPTEPLMFGAMMLFFMKLISEKSFDIKILKHPVTIIILIQLFWILFTTVTSEMPIVSLKFLLSRLWFVICFYFIGTQLFVKQSNYKIFFWCYLIPLIFVVLYTIIRSASYGFDEKSAHWLMQPFFKDHTSYGAILAMFIPVVFIFLTKTEKLWVRLVAFSFLTILIIGIILSFTRAAWVSLAAALILYFIYKYRIKFKYLATIGIIGLIVLAVNWNNLMVNLERNNQDSSAKLSEHLQSISNVSTDASNMERINRWTSAWLMFLERPVLGWGPGTYVFQYAPFQLAKNKTIISTNVGDNGNAHSEYIGPLAEQGLIGSVLVLLLISMVFYRGSTLYHRLPRGQLKKVVLFTLLGFFTYVVHGILNNYLDTDKASVPFWGFIALIVAIDVYHSKRLSESQT
jgi:O-antigen ligase